MSNKAIAAVVAAALVIGGGVVVIASSGGDDPKADVHQMQDGSTHTGTMPQESHTMDDGTMMGGSDERPRMESEDGMEMDY